ncbi:hypothetical protein ACFY0A_04690 [Streptomyces sp. NPDC001698]|uniref:hypothetical protein n=1 Tax=unclassified Streptomyces TaxID=2593676 RepID=UPI0036BFBB36
MSDITGRRYDHRGTAMAVVNESYSFACMRCGHGWEQSYEIEHYTDGDGVECVRYVADGRVVPSPLSRPRCQNCDGHVVRIMMAGRVSSAQSHLHPHEERGHHPAAPVANRVETSPPGEEAVDRAQDTHTGHGDHHWHLSDLLHPFHRKAG